ncbi:esterase-like activity of phytase family protein [Methylocapsa polymorpha]|uniref:Esterase-like activity of phytase family protein n=1 Tax=Methylocapsa polymorpha TaxID=3080828 RepID=A0ABZ0HUD2_9HYPH|nr:esterase-like activity of phytase family protein [Methylocapsa sp. RX1]
MRAEQFADCGARARRTGRTRLIAGVAAFLMLAGGSAAAQSVTFEGATFVNKGLVGVARVPSNAVDQFGETLGGWGSGMALDLEDWSDSWDGGYHGTLYTLPDRGWNTQGTTDFRGRLHRFDITLKPFYGASTANQNQLSLHYRSSTLFNGGKTTGLDPSGVQAATGHFPDLPIASNRHISVDDEAVVHPGDGTVWVSEEYGPYVYHYTLGGKLLGAIRPPEAFIPKRKDSSGNIVENFSADSPPIGVTYNPDPGSPLTGRQNNQGFEGLAMSPDRKTLFVLLQSALIQDLDPNNTKTTRRNTRLLAYDLRGPEPKLVGEYVVQLPLYQDQTTTKTKLLIAAQSELFALNDHQFLVLARDSSAGSTTSNPASVYRSIDLIDISKATNIAGTAYDQPGAPIAPLGVLNSAITPAAYEKFLDINDNTQLNRFGLHNGLPNDRNDLYEKWESIAVAPVGDRKAPNDYFLFVGSDNDFITQQGNMAGQTYQDASGANVDTLVLVYRVTLPTYIPPRRSDDFADGHGDWNDHSDRNDRR